MTTHALAALQAEVERKDVELVELRARVAELTSNMQKLVEAAATLDAEKRAEVERLRKVLGEIASHEHCELWSEGQPYKPGKTPSEIYKEGIQDGHRCAASIARAALAAQGGDRGAV